MVWKIKIVSFRWNLIPRLLPICRIKWWCSLFLFRPEILFLGLIDPKNEDCQSKLKFDTRNNLNMQNSMAMFTLSVLDRKHHLWANLVLVAHFSLVYLVDEFLCLFLVLLNKMRTLAESKVSVVNQGNEGGRWVEDFLVVPQGFGNFPSVFLRARWHIKCAWSVYIWFSQWWLVFVRGVIGQWAVVSMFSLIWFYFATKPL